MCLADALTRFGRVETVGFDYGQRHRIELDARLRVIAGIRDCDSAWRERLGEDHILALPTLAAISDTALTRDVAIEMTAAGLPNTFVPGRNLLFFSYAAALAYRRGIRTLVGGMCETDFSGYPDCRNDTLQTLARSLSLGMDTTFAVDTPLMWLTKAETWNLAHKLGGRPLVQLIIDETHTCYLGTRGQRHAWGHGCGTCPACALREKGFREWQSALS